MKKNVEARARALVRALGSCCLSSGLIASCALTRVEAASISMAPLPISPDDGDTWQVYIADEESYDSNLYRLPSGTPAVGTVAVPNATKQDYYNTSTVGANGQVVAGRQIIDMGVRADENKFANNTELDNVDYSGDLALNWHLSSYFSGQVSALFNHGLAGFDETRFLGRDLVNSQTYNASARYQIGPSWAVYGTGGDLIIDHGAAAAQLQNYRYENGSAGVEYATGLNDSFALEYKYANGKYPSGTLNSENGVFFSPDFHDKLEQFIMKYSVSDKTQLTAYLGYIQRTYPNTNFGSFSGPQGRLTMTWTATEKTQLLAAVWRELHAYLVSEADYFVSTGGSLSPTWLPTDKIKLALVLAYENQDYIPQSSAVLLPTTPIVPPSGSLNAKLKTATLELDYTPRDNWIVKFTANYQERTSNQQLFTYNDDLATIGVLYKIH